MLDVDIGNDAANNSVVDVAWASGGVPGQSQLLHFQNCLAYYVGVDVGAAAADKITSSGGSFQHKSISRPIAIEGGSGNCNANSNARDDFTEPWSSTAAYTRFLDKCMMYCANFQFDPLLCFQ